MRSLLCSLVLLLPLTITACNNAAADRTDDPDKEAVARGDGPDEDGDGQGSAIDCDDTDPNVYYGAQEVCADGIDNDCDGMVDGDDGSAARGDYMYDGDGDGAGDDWNGDGVLDVVVLCDTDDATAAAIAAQTGGNPDAVANYVEVPYEAPMYDLPTPDCDDDDATSYPGGTEVCDGADNNCDGTVDEGTPGETAWYADADEDTFGDDDDVVMSCGVPEGRVADNTDCDDTVTAVNPAATEVCDTIDNDCDGAIDDDDASISDQRPWYDDLDSDTFGAGTATMACWAGEGQVGNDDDCNDGDSAISPDGTEVCDAANADEDCDGAADDLDGSVADQTTWYRDADADLYGRNDLPSISSCDEPGGYVNADGDCNDASATVNPGAAESHNGIDDNCNGEVDEGSFCTTEMDYYSTGVYPVAVTVTGTPAGGYDGDVTATVGWSYSLYGYGSEYLAQATSSSFCFASGTTVEVDVELSDGTFGCMTDGSTPNGALYVLDDGVSLARAYGADDGSGHCVIEVTVP